MLIPRNQFNAFLCFYIVCIGVQCSGAYYTSLSVNDWYLGLNKPEITPPGIWFAVVWTMLYFLMAIAATRIYVLSGSILSRPMKWWWIQLLLGLIWSMFFFGAQAAYSAMIIIACYLVAVAMTMNLFSDLDRKATWAMAPLFGWLCFATYLNVYIVQHN